MDPTLLSEVVELLEACSNYLEAKADVSDGIPNRPMKLMNDCDEMANKLFKLALVGAR